MVNITLSNYNLKSPIDHACININNGSCLLSNNRELSLKQLFSQSDFIHPLLSEPFTPSPYQLYHYEYNNIDELLYSGIYVYSRLIRVNNPLACIFKIAPSPHFHRSKVPQSIDFSINSHKQSQESISMKQLEDLITQLSGFKYEYSEDIIIDDQFTIADLPLTVDGDALYQTNSQILALLKAPRDFRRYDIRYISPEIGFGVFSKELIKRGEIISLYTGIKMIHDPPIFSFSFLPKQDCFMMRIDSAQQGNITRFINHAPKQATVNQKSLIEANLETSNYCLNGIEVIFYSARKDILQGEQLLIDYGPDYFENAEEFAFLTNGRVINTNKWFTFSNWQKKLYQLRLMALNGVKKAQIYLMVRMFIIITLILVVLKVPTIISTITSWIN